MSTANVSLNLRPYLPKQREFMEASEKYLGYVGGMGSGKTAIMSANAIYLSMEYPGNRGVIDSPSYPKLRDDVIPVFKEICPPEILYDAAWDRAFHGTNYDLRFANGSIVNFRSPDDPDKVRGPTLGFFGLDEGGLREEEFFDAYRGRLRKPGVRLCGMVASNPESKLHWMYKKFVEKDDETPRNTYKLFRASSRENIYLPPEYIEDLEQYPPEWREKFLEGHFTAFSGQIYGEIYEGIHLIEPAEWLRWLEQAYGSALPPDWWNFGGGIDPAESQPTAGWFCFKDERDYSWYVARYSEENRVTSQHCEGIKEICERWNQDPENVDLVIDPTATAKRVEGKSLIDGYFAGGLWPRPAESCRRKDSVNWGINLVRERLHPDPRETHPISGEKGCPKVFFVMYPDVKEGLRYVTAYRWSSQNVFSHTGKDKARKYQDHDPDALRYREVEFLDAPKTAVERHRERRRRESQAAEVDPDTGFAYE